MKNNNKKKLNPGESLQQEQYVELKAASFMK